MTDRTVRVLVVDDEEGMRHMLRLTLERAGYEILEAQDGAEALSIAAAERPMIALCDLRMPGVDGLTFLRNCREQKIATSVVMMSAYIDLDAAVAAMKEGAVDYVSKPFRGDEVVLKLRLIEERRRLDEEKSALAAENRRLRSELGQPETLGIIGTNPGLLKILQTVRKVADYKSTVLLLGESGTGKELIARAVHRESIRANGPFVPINCGAIPETLLESELFGYVKGSFTDATRSKVGLVEQADRGTLFLDEIGELPLALQVKLLRFLQEDEIRRIGDTKDTKVDVRVVAATARDLPAMTHQGTFREDLYYRLNVVQLTMPALRDRRDDIPLLVEHFVARFSARYGRGPLQVDRDAMRLLVAYDWPGNVRELENAVERAMVLADDLVIRPADLPDRVRSRGPGAVPAVSIDNLSIKQAVVAVEKELIQRALEKTNGNRTRAAEHLEISHRALLYKLKEYNIK